MTNEIQLKVAVMDFQDRLDAQLGINSVMIHGDRLRELGIRPGATVLIRSETDTVAIVQKAVKNILRDEIRFGLGILVRVRTISGQEVTVSAISIPEARSVTIAPVETLVNTKERKKVKKIAMRKFKDDIVSVGDIWTLSEPYKLWSIAYQVVRMYPEVETARMSKITELHIQDALSQYMKKEQRPRKVDTNQESEISITQDALLVRDHLWLSEHKMKIVLHERSRQRGSKKSTKAKEVVVSPLPGKLVDSILKNLPSDEFAFIGQSAKFLGYLLSEGQTIWIPILAGNYYPFRVLSTKPKSPVLVTNTKQLKIIVDKNLPEANPKDEWWVKPRVRDIPSIWQLIGNLQYKKFSKSIQPNKLLGAVNGYLEAIRNVSQEDKETATNLRMELASIYMRLANEKEESEYIPLAQEMFDEALDMMSKETMPEEWANCCMLLGDLHLTKGESSKSIALYNDALSFVTIAFDSGQHARLLSQLGIAYERMSVSTEASLEKEANATKAIKYLLSASDILKKLDREYEHPSLFFSKIRLFTLEVGITEWRLGAAFFALSSVKDKEDNSKKAIKCYRTAMRHFTRKDFGSQHAILLANIGNVFLAIAEGKNRKKNAKKAIEAFSESLYIQKLLDSDFNGNDLEKAIREGEKVMTGIEE